MTQTSTPAPVTSPPTDAEWEDHRRWAVPPVGSRRQMWVAREAQAIFTARTGRADPWPALEDYRAANAVIPQDPEPTTPVPVPDTATALEDVEVLPVPNRVHAHPLTWAWDGDTEAVGLECEGCEDVFEVSGVGDPAHTLDGDDCPRCHRGWTRRVILAWTPRAWDRPIARP